MTCVFLPMTLDGASPGPADQRDRALLRRVDAGQRVEQRRLAGAVRADDGQDLAAVHLQRDVVEADDAAEAQRHVLDVEDDVGARWRFGRPVARVITSPSARGTAATSDDCRRRPVRRAPPCAAAPGSRPAGRKIIIASTSAPTHIGRSGCGTWYLQELGQPGQHGRTGHRAGDRAHAAEHDVGDDQDRGLQGEQRRVEVADLAGVERAGQRRTSTRRWRTRAASRASC